MIVEQAPAATAAAAGERAPRPTAAVGAVGQVRRGAARAGAPAGRPICTRHPDLDVHDVAWTLAGRSTFDHRAVVLGADRDQLLAGSGRTGRRRTRRQVVTVGHAAPAGKTVFVFPGQGCQWLGMGVELLDASPVFAEQHARRARRRSRSSSTGRCVDVLRGASGAPGLDRVDVVQPALFAVMVSLAELWRSVGVTPDAVIGHSQGEIAAAYVAGALSLRDAARVVALRSKLLRRAVRPGGHGVAGVQRRPRAGAVWSTSADRVGIAAVNGRSAVVVSGERAALDELVAPMRGAARSAPAGSTWTTRRTRLRSRPIRDELREALAGHRAASTRTAFFSTVTGELVDTADLDAEYWYRNIRQTVEFDQAVRTACEHGYRAFVESSPHPALIAGIEDTVTDCSDAADDPSWCPSLGPRRRRPRPLPDLGRAGVRLRRAAWIGAACAAAANCVELPTYAFERRRFWLSGGGRGHRRRGLGAGRRRRTRCWAPSWTCPTRVRWC